MTSRAAGFLLARLSAVPALVAELSATVVGIIDEGALRLLVDRTEVVVRFAETVALGKAHAVWQPPPQSLAEPS